KNALLLRLGRENSLLLDGGDEILLLLAGEVENLCESGFPGKIAAGLEVVLLLIREEANVDENLDKLGETLVPEGATDNSLRLGDVVAFLVWGRVAIGVGNESISRVDEVGLGSLHEFRSVNLDNLAVLVELCTVAESEEDAAGGPRELVSKRVVAVFGGRETTTV